MSDTQLNYSKELIAELIKHWLLENHLSTLKGDYHYANFAKERVKFWEAEYEKHSYSKRKKSVTLRSPEK